VPSYLEMVLYSREEPRDNRPLIVHPLAIIEEPMLPTSDSLEGGSESKEFSSVCVVVHVYLSCNHFVF
jgi:hypothetical protein